MKPIVVDTSCDLEGPIELVWELLTDWERQTEWMLEMSDVRLLSDQREGIGVRAEATVKVGGIRTRDVIRVDVWNPPNDLGLAHEGWVSGRGDIKLSRRNDGGTSLAWREVLEPPWGVLGAVGLRIFRPLLAWVFRRDLRVLQELVRSRATRGYPGNST